MVRLQTRIFSHRACVSILLLFFLFFVLFGPALAGQDKAPTEAAAANSVVAIGDVHGDFDDFVTILQKAGLIDEQHHWTGGKTTFVQVGDLLDRGPKPRDVMDLMMSLEKEAPKAGGRIVGLLGNHEMMNIMGDLRYVTPAEVCLSGLCEVASRSFGSHRRASAADGTDGTGVDGTAPPGFCRTA